MIHTSELGSALRYRYKSMVSVFLLVTCACWWLFATHANHGSTPTQVAPMNQLAQQPLAPAVSETPADTLPPASVRRNQSAGLDAPLARPHAVVATRNDAQVKQLQTSLWSAIDRQNSIESRLAELSIPAAPIVRQPAAITSVNPELRAATARVAAANSTLAELQTRYTDVYPDVVQAKDELAEAERALYSARHLASSSPVKARVVAPTPPSPQVEAERTALRTELAELLATITDLKSQLGAASALPRHRPNVLPAAHDDTYWPLVLPHSAGEATSAPQPIAPVAVPTVTGSLPQAAVPNPLLSARSFLFLPQSMLLGFLASGILFALLESLDHTIKGPESLREALPAEARQISLRSMRA